MKRFPITTWAVLGILVALLGSAGSSLFKGLELLSVQAGLCVEDNEPCRTLYSCLAVLAVLVLCLVADLLRRAKGEWSGVAFSPWIPTMLKHEILGGIKVHNGTDEDLNDCVAELVGFEEDSTGGGFSDLMHDNLLPSKLLWLADQDLAPTTSIGRGRDGYVTIAFPLDKTDVQPVGDKLHYKIKSVNTSLVDMVTMGFLDVRFHAKRGNRSITPLLKSLRLERDADALRLPDVIIPREKKSYQDARRAQASGSRM